VVVGKLLVGLLMVATLGLVACGGDDEPSAEEAQANLCTSLDELQTQVTALTDLGLDSTVDDVQDALGNIQDAFDEVVDDAQEVADVETQELGDAIDSLESTISDIGDGTSIGDALTAIADELTAIGTAWQDLFTSTDC
jgi:hypothetical protein